MDDISPNEAAARTRQALSSLSMDAAGPVEQAVG